MRSSVKYLMVYCAICLCASSSLFAQLPNCTITFDDSCPDSAAECGASFIGGEGCQVIGVAHCYSSGVFSYQVAQGGSLTITLDDDLNSLNVFFAHQDAGGEGSMRFLDAAGAEIDTPLETNGPCDAPSMPDPQERFFSGPVRSIEVDNTGSGNIWIDTFEVNPPCGGAEDCDDAEVCTVDTCDAGQCTHTPLDCDDGVGCTLDQCAVGTCQSTPDDANCPDDGIFCNGIESCDIQLDCVSSGDPCTVDEFCNDATASCDDCLADGDCDDELEDTTDTCVGGQCVFTPIPADCAADLNGDQSVDAADLAILLGAWGSNPGHVADLSADGVVDAADLAQLLGSWGPCEVDPQCQQDADCDDSDACTDDTCDPTTGCANTDVDCDDSLDCTDDNCDIDTGCVNTNTCEAATPICTASGCVECETDADCDTAASETCVAGVCGTVSACADDTDCDDGIFCNGNESCDVQSGTCLAGVAPCLDQFCDEQSAACLTCVSNEDCDDGVFCNGAEFCDAESDSCQNAGAPCSEAFCVEATETCLPCASDDDCHDDLFCNGIETCVDAECRRDGSPCTVEETCFEIRQECLPTEPAGDGGDDNENDNGEETQELDDDGDGVLNDVDQCPATPANDAVDASGCSESQDPQGNSNDNGDLFEDDMDGDSCAAGLCGGGGMLSMMWLISALMAMKCSWRRKEGSGARV